MKNILLLSIAIISLFVSCSEEEPEKSKEPEEQPTAPKKISKIITCDYEYSSITPDGLLYTHIDTTNYKYNEEGKLSKTYSNSHRVIDDEYTRYLPYMENVFEYKNNVIKSTSTRKGDEDHPYIVTFILSKNGLVDSVYTDFWKLDRHYLDTTSCRYSDDKLESYDGYTIQWDNDNILSEEYTGQESSKMEYSYTDIKDNLKISALFGIYAMEDEMYGMGYFGKCNTHLLSGYVYTEDTGRGRKVRYEYTLDEHGLVTKVIKIDISKEGERLSSTYEIFYE